MSCERQTNKGFTLIELMVAIGLLAIVLSFAGVIFNAGINTYRTALANAEIMRKLRAITDQLDSDFQGLRKDGEIFVAWVANEAGTAAYDGYHDCDDDWYERFDRIMFFSLGDFQSYKTAPLVRGNIARICYMLATDGAGKRPEEYRDMRLTEEAKKKRQEDRRNRILARTQHILVPPDPALDDFDPAADWYRWNNWYEYDEISLEEWKHILWADKQNMLTVISDVNVGTPTVGFPVRGAHVDPADPNLIHILLCEGVGEFKIQGWYDAERRWVPEIDPDGDRDLTDRSDFFWLSPGVLDHARVPWVLYPFRVSVPPETYGWVNINGIGYGGPLDETDFNSVPGLGRALKFTFTLYDSKGVIEQGRTFTHIVYLD